jgi:hypothetical protein
MSEGLTVDASGGAPTLMLSDGATATFDAANSDLSAGFLTFNYIVGDGDQSQNLEITKVNVPANTSVDDTNNLAVDFAGAIDVGTGLQIGLSPLTVTSVMASSNSGEAGAGATIKLTLAMSEPMMVNTSSGSPTLLLNDGATATYDASASDPAANKLVFDYIVGDGDETPNLAIAAVNLNGAAIEDGSGYNADFSAAPAFNTGLQIGPTFVESISTNGGSEASGGQTIQVTLAMDGAVSVSGLPTLTLNDGGTAIYNSSASMPSTGDLVFGSTPDLEVAKVNILVDATVLDANGVSASFLGALDVPTGVQIVPCYCPGTLIRTDSGDVPVESLAIGDGVVTVSGESRAIKWIGRRVVSTVFAEPLRFLPIRIKVSALADNVPSRDLLLSPDHAVLVDDVLIQAGALVNGTSVVRANDMPVTFTYYHVELDDHSLILAENTLAETFVDNVDRMAFDNWAEYEALYPDGKPIVEMSYPRAKAHRQVPRAIRERLAERGARLFGTSVPAAA